MSALTDTYIDQTYNGLLHTGGVPIPSTGLTTVYDGLGNASALAVGKSGVGINVAGILSIGGVSLIDIIHPIGSVFFSTVDSSPTAVFGGTWERIATGRFIAGVGTGTDGTTSRMVTMGESGGEYVHTLVASEIPSHYHTLNENLHRDNVTVEPTDIYAGQFKDIDHNWYASTRTGSVGGDKPHNNTPPAFGLYMWRRTL